MEKLQQTPIYQAINQPVLLFGAERNLVIFLIMMATMLIWMGGTWFTFFVGLIIWIVGIYYLREMAKRDPIMSSVFRRYQQYKHYYPAYTTPFAYFKNVN
ncbi:MAG: VirB3 family type IV secretion system protein [Sulfurovaceae bacterium]|nr:VirB3 family type IV secretion system protein [Sulfurovaceae bacterium]